MARHEFERLPVVDVIGDDMGSGASVNGVDEAKDGTGHLMGSAQTESGCALPAGEPHRLRMGNRSKGRPGKEPNLWKRLMSIPYASRILYGLMAFAIGFAIAGLLWEFMIMPSIYKMFEEDASTRVPTRPSTLAPTRPPALALPTLAPTLAPTRAPTLAPTLTPTLAPTLALMLAPAPLLNTSSSILSPSPSLTIAHTPSPTRCITDATSHKQKAQKLVIDASNAYTEARRRSPASPSSSSLLGNTQPRNDSCCW